ncbi:MAG: trypsin-like peptidase domain-containing protein [Ruminococcus sp.]|nr:trypsin-like peptidase domain-containing protein [Ruminococcus sp.]
MQNQESTFQPPDDTVPKQPTPKPDAAIPEQPAQPDTTVPEQPTPQPDVTISEQPAQPEQPRYIPPQRNWQTPPYAAPQPQQPTPQFSANSVPLQTNWYDQSQPQYGGFAVPPQMPPAEKPPLSPEKKDRRTAFWLKIASALIALLLLYCIGSDIYAYRHGATVQITASTTNTSSSAEVTIQQQDKPTLDTDAEGVDENGAYTVEGVAAAVCHSIVEIDTYTDADATYLSGTGSGIILSEDGYIITNAHVITDGESFEVITDDEVTYTATVVGSDTKTDIAVIKVDAENLPAATMGNSDEIVLGEAVVAIGNPAGLTGSVTNGIVSGLNRQIRSDATGFDMNCIQTNAAISPGNSGGALVNMYGQVIGITSSKYVSSSYEGLGFAITINEVLPIVEDLIENGYVSGRMRIGITMISLESSEIQLAFCNEIGLEDIPDDLTGVWITAIDEECDIASTDLQINDVIVSVEGQAVGNYDKLTAAIDGIQAGETVHAVCRRYAENGDETQFNIAFQLMEDTSGNY